MTIHTALSLSGLLKSRTLDGSRHLPYHLNGNLESHYALKGLSSQCRRSDFSFVENTLPEEKGDNFGVILALEAQCCTPKTRIQS